MSMKRQRLALSCVDCRKRKVKCGREMPSCVRCVRGGHGDDCFYVQYDEKSLSTPTDESPDGKRNVSPAQSWAEEADHWQRTSATISTDAVRGNPLKRRKAQMTNDQLHERVFELERQVQQNGLRSLPGENWVGMHPPAGHGASSHNGTLQNVERSLLRGGSFRTQYFGPTHAASLLLQFAELSVFVKDILRKTPYFEKVKTDLKEARKENHLASNAQKVRDFQEFAAMVPQKVRADALLEQYFDTFETTYRILHVPSFKQMYDQFWTDPEASNVHFVVQLLLICASVSCVVAGETNAFVGRSSVMRETATRWIESSETWLNHHSHKHTTLEYYQTHVLLAIAKRMIFYKIKREWTVAGNLLRIGLAAGFHREPSFLSKKICPFDQEMRRRLWFTILELELHASCARGTRASITWEDWDSLPPRNIHDEDFNPTTQTMPSSLPLSTFTRTSFLCSAITHLPLRLEMLNSLNSINSSMTLPTTMAYDERIRNALDSLPTYQPPINIKPTSFPTALSKLLLHEFLLLLHQPFATTSLSQSRHFYSRCARRDSALTILQIYTSSFPTTSQPSLPLPSRLTLANIRDDSLRACLSTCHDTVITAPTPGTRPSSSDPSKPLSLSISYIESIVSLFATRVKTLGQGFHSYWITSSALALVGSKTHPETSSAIYVQEAADRVLRLHDEIMALQENGYSGHVFMGKLHAHAQRRGLVGPNGTAVEGDGLGGQGARGGGGGGGGGAGVGDGNVSGCGGGGVEQGYVMDGFTLVDPFGQSVFDFDNFDIWNMGIENMRFGVADGIGS